MVLFRDFVILFNTSRDFITLSNTFINWRLPLSGLLLKSVLSWLLTSWITWLLTSWITWLLISWISWQRHHGYHDNRSCEYHHKSWISWRIMDIMTRYVMDKMTSMSKRTLNNNNNNNNNIPNNFQTFRTCSLPLTVKKCGLGTQACVSILKHS